MEVGDNPIAVCSVVDLYRIRGAERLLLEQPNKRSWIHVCTGQYHRKPL